VPQFSAGLAGSQLVQSQDLSPTNTELSSLHQFSLQLLHLLQLGAASTYVDAILFFGSFAAQMLMVYEKYESWVIWLIVDAGYIALYASQGLLFTTLLYVVFTVLAALGWSKWYAAHRSAIRSL
jgi:nicotinamide mononucleotide transporter PnuC